MFGWDHEANYCPATPADTTHHPPAANDPVKWRLEPVYGDLDAYVGVRLDRATFTPVIIPPFVSVTTPEMPPVVLTQGRAAQCAHGSHHPHPQF
jgi:hypothetical protein